MDSLSPRDLFQQELPLFIQTLFEHVIDGCQCQGKLCTKCEKPKCFGAFHRDNHNPDKLTSQCKQCRKEYRHTYIPSEQARANKKAGMKAWNETHREEKKVYSKAYRQAHQERICSQKRAHYTLHRQEIRASQAIYYQSHREQKHRYNVSYWRTHAVRLKAQNKQYYRNNIESVKQANRLYCLSHIEQKRVRDKAYREAHTDRRLAHNRAYKSVHPERYRLWMRVAKAKRRAIQANTGGSYTVAEWQALKIQYDYTCLCCGKQEPDIKLTADHVIPVTRGGHSFISNIQPLCGPCNSKKHNKIIDYRVRWQR